MRKLILLMIIPYFLTGFPSCAGTSSTVQTVTQNADGSTTTTSVPVMSPKDQAFHDNCKAVLERTFQP